MDDEAIPPGKVVAVARVRDDVKPATDEEIADLEAWADQNGIPLRAVQPLIARIRADAARLARMEEATKRLLDALDAMHSGGETFTPRVSLAAFTVRAALDGRDG